MSQKKTDKKQEGAALGVRRIIAKQISSASIAGALSVLSVPAIAQDTTIDPCSDEAVLSCAAGDILIYKPGFFAQFNPITALDMVARVPGFSIDRGENVRGFGGAAGNVLIDGQRPSTKSADITDQLGRVAAGNVAYLELIRGGAGGLDVGGQAVVVNVVTKSTGAGRDAAPWEFSLIKRRPGGGLRPNGEISFTGDFGQVQYKVGLNFFTFSTRFDAEEDITRFTGVDEIRQRDGVYRENSGGANLSLERPFANGDIARLNVEAGYERVRETYGELRTPEAGAPSLAEFSFPFEEFEYEIGADYEHAFTDTFGVKLIGLFGREQESFESSFIITPEGGAPSPSLFVSDQTEGETIGRLEFDWTGWESHTIQFGGEVAQNFIESEAAFFSDDGAGGLQPVDLDGANTRVSELRGEPFITDSWRMGEKLTLDAGFAVELSRIAQSGDNANSRFFVYPKPNATLTYAQNDQTQWRFSAEREVNQLSFDEFVSSVNFDDEDVDFGNPDLQPQRVWAFEAAFERRFGDIGVIELKGFFDYVQDVEDLLPIGGIVEVPGNIGDGKIYGGAINLTAPLDWAGLKNARLETEITFRDSVVEDPVTGLDRNFSFTPNQIYEVEFRQDFPAQKWSWGWEIFHRSEELGFGLDEVSSFTTQPDIVFYAETTVIKGVKVRFNVNDILNVANKRDRTVFDGSRATNPPLFRELRRNRNGGAFRLTLSGAF